MAELRRHRSVSQGQLHALLTAELDDLVPGEWRALDIVDVGGGTGGLAVSLARSGHHLTVVDPSPDALASLQRRTAEAPMSGRIRGVQGDTTDLASILGPGRTDVVLCHRVVEVVDSPAEALAAIATVLRPGGVLSLLVAQRHALVLSQALAGHIALARRTYADRSRLDQARVLELVRAAGFAVLSSHGIGAIADHVPESLLDAEPGAYDELDALESEIRSDPVFRAIAPQIHVLAQRRLSR